LKLWKTAEPQSSDCGNGKKHLAGSRYSIAAAGVIFGKNMVE
jgi:hypothetical protein